MRTSFGTLGIAVPTRRGLVVAADSRASNEYQTRFCDEDCKLQVPVRPDRIAILITGLCELRRSSNESDFCKHLREAHSLLNVREVVRRFLEDATGLQIPSVNMGQIVQDALIPAYASLSSEARDIIRPIRMQCRSSINFFHYDLVHSVACIRSCTVALSSELVPYIEDEIRCDDRQTDACAVYRFGEHGYVDNCVLSSNGVGHKFLSKETKKFLNHVICGDKTVGDIGKSQGLGVAIDVIEAASRTAETVRPPTAIGGPVDVLFLGADLAPIKERWKKGS
jgi:hypothetical protein